MWEWVRESFLCFLFLGRPTGINQHGPSFLSVIYFFVSPQLTCSSMSRSSGLIVDIHLTCKKDVAVFVGDGAIADKDNGVTCLRFLCDPVHTTVLQVDNIRITRPKSISISQNCNF